MVIFGRARGWCRETYGGKSKEETVQPFGLGFSRSSEDSMVDMGLGCPQNGSMGLGVHVFQALFALLTKVCLAYSGMQAYPATSETLTAVDYMPATHLTCPARPQSAREQIRLPR